MQLLAVMTRCSRAKTAWRNVDRVRLDLIYGRLNIKVKRFLLQNFRTLFWSTDDQRMSKLDVSFLMQPPFVAYKRDVSLSNMMVRSTDDASSEQTGSRACQRLRLELH